MARKPRAEAAAVVKSIRLSPAEWERIARAAKIVNRPVSNFIVHAALMHAADVLTAAAVSTPERLCSGGPE